MPRVRRAGATFATTDPDGAKRFYTELLGWEVDDRPIPGDGVYSMLLKEGKEAAALSQAPQGVGTFWNSYTTVDSADESAARAKELGGAALMEPFDVMEAGRMATLQDPTGAVFSVWQANQSIGAQVVNEPGALSLTPAQHHRPGEGDRLRHGAVRLGRHAVRGGPRGLLGHLARRS